ncbi:MAG: VWA domain-containing protein [Dehalococcoidales bacterium]|nr:VWA domain-containing protein [Dehalococcoidales bacterium]
MKTRKILSAIVLTVIVTVTIGIPCYASISPESITATLEPGESVYETKTVHIEAIPPEVDVVFAFDLTGSMGEILTTAKTKALDIMTTLTSALGSDVQFGVMSYMDYPHWYEGYAYNCGYLSQDYGNPSTDYAYSLDQSITGDTTAVSTAISGLILGFGEDSPEDYTRMMYESYADPAVAWRMGAKRIVVNFGDNVPHDCNLNEGVPGYSTGWSTGGDPGRDEAMNTADDLDLQIVLAEMYSNGVTLIECHTNLYYKTHWDYWTGITGGIALLTGSATLVNDVANAVNSVLSAEQYAYGVHLVASPGYESWVSFDPVLIEEMERCVDDEEIDVTITVPVDTLPGVYQFTISVVDEDDVSYGDQQVTIIVPGDEPPPVEVGGTVQPTNKWVLLTPWLILGILLAALGTVIIWRRKAQS